jgi:predicted transcriptional regulator
MRIILSESYRLGPFSGFMKYRSRSDIIESILRTSNKGATMSRIRYGSCLSHSQLIKYLEFLQDRKLLQFDSSYKHYTLTERGLYALGAFGELNEMTSTGECQGGDNDIIAKPVYPYRRLLQVQERSSRTHALLYLGRQLLVLSSNSVYSKSW